MKTVTITLTAAECDELGKIVGSALRVVKALVLAGEEDPANQRRLLAALSRLQSISRTMEAAQPQTRRRKPTAIVPRNRKTPRATRTR